MMSRADPPAFADDVDRAERILKGDRETFEHFVDELLPVLHRFAARRLGGDQETVRDVVQSTVCKAIESLPKYRGTAPLVSWVCGICRHEVFAVYKGRKRTEQRELVEESPEIHEALAVLRADEAPDEELVRKQTVSLVHLTLDQLPDSYGSVLEMKYVEGLSVREIAARRESSEKACESLLTRARAAFRDTFPKVARGLSEGADA